MRQAYAGNYGDGSAAPYGDASSFNTGGNGYSDQERVSDLKQAINSIEKRLASAAMQAAAPSAPAYAASSGMPSGGLGHDSQQLGMLQAQINQLAAQVSSPAPHHQPQRAMMGNPASAADEIVRRQQMLNANVRGGLANRHARSSASQNGAVAEMAGQLSDLKQELAKISAHVAKPIAVQSSVPQKEIDRIAHAIAELQAKPEPTTENFDRLTQELSSLRDFMKHDVQSAIQKGMKSKAGSQAQDLAQRIEALSTDMQTAIRTEVQGKDTAVMTDLNHRLDTLSQVVDQLSVQSANAVNPRVDGLVEQIDALRVTVDDLPQTLAISRLEDRLNDLGSKIEGAETREHASIATSTLDLSSVEARLDEIARALVAVSNNQNKAPVVDMSAVDRVEARMSELARTLDTLHTQDNTGELDSLAVRIDGLTERLGSFEKYAEAGDLGAASALFAAPDTGVIEDQLRSLNARLDQTEITVDNSSLEEQIRNLSLQVEQASNVHSTSAQISNLEAQIGLIIRQMGKEEGAGGFDFSPVEARLGQIENQLAQNQNFSLEAAQQAAQHAVSMMGPQNDVGQVIEALSHDLKSLQLIAEGGNAQSQQTVDHLQQTLDQVVDRLGSIEGSLQDGAIRQATMVASDQVGVILEETEDPVFKADEAAFASDGLVDAAKADEKLGLSYGINADAEVSSAAENQPLEPGSAMPGVDAQPHPVTAKLDAAISGLNESGAGVNPQGPLEDFPSDDMRPDAVAAARRALQATTAEMSAVRKETTTRKRRRSKKGLSGLFASSGKSRLRKPLILGAAALLLAVVTFKTIGLFTGSANKPIAKVKKPAVEMGLTKKSTGSQLTAPTTKKNQLAATPKLTAPKPTVRTIGRESVVPTADGPTSTFKTAKSEPKPQIMAKPVSSAPVTAEVAKPAPSERVSMQVSLPVAKIETPKPAATEPLVEPVKSAYNVPSNAGPAALVAAASSGDPKALFQVAMRYSDGKGVSRNMTESAKWFRHSAEAGFAPAQYSIGSLYEKGIGVERDVTQASSWYQKAAGQGNARAMHNLAVIYAMGNPPSIQPNMDTAVIWFKKAAGFGIKDSQFNLGILYGQGMGVPQNLSESYKWFALAAKTGDGDAGKKRDEVANAMDPDDLSDARKLVNNWAPKKLKESVNRVAVPEEWRGNASGSAAAVAPKTNQLVKKTQALLNQRGFEVGEPDGLIGPKTKRAIMEFQRSADMPVTGKVDKQLLQALEI